MKRFFQIILGILGLILLLLLVIPSLFKGKIEKKVTEVINQNINATVSFDDFSLSMFRYFPNLSMGLDGLTIVNKAPFEGDTLMHVNSFNASVDLWSAIAGDGIQINSVLLNEPQVWLKVNKDSVANWDIIPESDSVEQPEDTAQTVSDFTVQLELFEIRGAKLGYSDATMNISSLIDGFNAEMRGDLSQKSTSLDLQSSIQRLGLNMDGVNYLNDAFVSLDAIIGADLENMVFSFKENEFRLNDLVLGFDGTFGMLEEGYDLDVSLATKETSFKTLLSMIPEAYLKDFESLKTGGTLSLKAGAKGKFLDSDHLPAFNVDLTVQNGLIQYPDLPESIRDIQIKARVENPGGSMDSTVTDINKFHFQLADNPFDASMWVGTPVSNATYKGKMTGTIDLASLLQAIPMDSIELEGVIFTNMTIDGDYNMVENERYDQIQANGNVSINNFLFATTDMPAPFSISQADLKITPRFMELKSFNSSLGSSDFSLRGKVENYLSYVLKDETLEGTLQHHSKLIDTNELMQFAGEEDSTNIDADTTQMELVIVPKNLEFSLNSDVDRMVYDKLVMTNMKGGITIKNGRVILDGLHSQMLDGELVVSGEYNTADTLRPFVDFNFALNTIDVHKAANSFSMIDSMMPIAKIAVGTVTTKMDFNSMIANDMSPILSSVNGGGILNSKGVEISGAKVQNAMAQMLKNDKYKKARAEDLAINFKLKNGDVIIEPFTASIYGKTLTISGTQGLDQSLDYIIKMPVSRKELGDVAGLLGTALPSSSKDMMVDILVKGSVKNPQLEIRLDEEFKNQAKKELEDKAKKAVDEFMKDPDVKEKVDEVKNKLKDLFN